MARDPKRIPRMLRSLEALWYTMPDMRLGQLVETLVATDPYYADSTPFYVEDEDMEVAIEKLLARTQ